MASLTPKIINGHKYYYARISKRVNSKPKIIKTIYLGTLDNIIKNARSADQIPQASEVCISELGATGALFDIAKRLQFVEIIDRHVPKRRQGPTVGQYMLVAAINRASKPTSKAALSQWFENTIGPSLMNINPKQLTSQAFWNHMDKLTEQKMIDIENDLLVKIIDEFKIDLNCLLYDATNFYTYIDTRTKSQLAQRGHNKQKRHDLRQVSLGMMTSADFHVPLLHMVYGGNINDVKQFGSVINELVNRYKQLTEACPRITVVFDKGNNSGENLESFKATKMHFVGSLRLNQCKELLKVPLRQYRDLKYTQDKELKVYRTQRKVFSQKRTVLVIYNENLLAGQLQGIGHNIRKCKSELTELKTKLHKRATGKIRKGKNPTPEGIKKKVDTILRREYMNEIIKTTISTKDGFVHITYSVDKEAIGRLSQTVLGKTILFTDNHKWSDEQIVAAYRAQYKIEHAFREMKNPHFLGWNPRLHWTDQKIRVHAFYCVAALTFVSLIRRELAAKGMTISAENLMEQLNGIRQTVCVYPQAKGQPPKLSYSMSRLNKTQEKLYNLLKLACFRHS